MLLALLLYLSDLIQFAVRSELTLIDGLYTSGDELTVKLDNSNYCDKIFSSFSNITSS